MRTLLTLFVMLSFASINASELPIPGKLVLGSCGSQDSCQDCCDDDCGHCCKEERCDSDCRGKRGKRGPKGPSGPTGPRGPTGPAGPPGFLIAFGVASNQGQMAPFVSNTLIPNLVLNPASLNVTTSIAPPGGLQVLQDGIYEVEYHLSGQINGITEGAVISDLQFNISYGAPGYAPNPPTLTNTDFFSVRQVVATIPFGEIVNFSASGNTLLRLTPSNPVLPSIVGIFAQAPMADGAYFVTNIRAEISVLRVAP